jgi:hypothetical protein
LFFLFSMPVEDGGRCRVFVGFRRQSVTKISVRTMAMYTIASSWCLSDIAVNQVVLVNDSWQLVSIRHCIGMNQVVWWMILDNLSLSDIVLGWIKSFWWMILDNLSLSDIVLGWIKSFGEWFLTTCFYQTLYCGESSRLVNDSWQLVGACCFHLQRLRLCESRTSLTY